MKAEELKLKAIQDAYGEYFEICNPDKNGWTKYSEVKNEDVNMHDSFVEFTDTCLDIEAESWRPKSLSGIENNNGWVLLNGTPNEITYQGDIWIEVKNGEILFIKEDEYIPLNVAVAYQPVIKPKPPIY